MSRDAKQELEAVKEQLHEKTAKASSYMQDNDRLQVHSVCSSGGHYLCEKRIK